MGRAGEGRDLHFGHVDFEMTLRNSKDDHQASDWAKRAQECEDGSGLEMYVESMAVAEITNRRSREGRESRGNLEKDQH